MLICRAIFLPLLAIVVSVGSSPTAIAADAKSIAAAVESITARELKQHVSVLASDTFEGREAGSRGGKAAGAYLVDTIKRFEAKPGGSSSYYQFFNANFRNILVVIPGSDPVLKEEYIVVSSHYDHVGFGSSRNSYGPIGRIHNGADDNASGTSGLLELIEAFGEMKPAPRRSILFAFWDAEEKGLLGSEHWVSHPTVPLKQVKLMFNVDMIGRLRNNSLEMYGVRTAAGLRRLLCEANRGINLALEFNWDTKRESDHYPFYARRIPYVMFHTRKHENYHRPSDDVDKLNIEGMQKIVRMMFRSIYTVADAAELAKFRSAALSESSGTRLLRMRRGVTRPPRLGVVWDRDISETDKGIVRIKEVRAGSPAQQAGLKVGDRIVKFDGVEIESTKDFGLRVVSAVSPVQVVVNRKGEAEPITLEVPLKGAPERIGISFTSDDAEPGVVRITRVTPGSPADIAGVKPHHRVYAVGGRQFTTNDEFHKLVTTLPSPIKLLLEGRGTMGETELNLLPLAKKPDEDDETAEPESKTEE